MGPSLLRAESQGVAGARRRALPPARAAQRAPSGPRRHTRGAATMRTAPPGSRRGTAVRRSAAAPGVSRPSMRSTRKSAWLLAPRHTIVAGAPASVSAARSAHDELAGTVASLLRAEDLSMIVAYKGGGRAGGPRARPRGASAARRARACLAWSRIVSGRCAARSRVTECVGDQLLRLSTLRRPRAP